MLILFNGSESDCEFGLPKEPSVASWQYLMDTSFEDGVPLNSQVVGGHSPMKVKSMQLITAEFNPI